jgi:uncharacterized damage-inducible protein DinB
MTLNELLSEYAAGPELLSKSIVGMSPEQIDAAPVPGKWSTRQVICHLADFEPVYADRMKRVIAEDQPPLRSGDPDVFAARLAYEARDIGEELDLIRAVRAHTVRILRTLPESAFERTGVHSTDGPRTLRRLLEQITNHIPHHVRTIEVKRRALGLK